VTRILAMAVVGTAFLLGLSPDRALAAGGPAARMERVVTDPRDTESLQRGAKLFVNYCLNCHSAKYMRYNALTNIGLTDQQITENLILTGRFDRGPDGALQFAPTKIGETMQVAMPAADAKAWFGTMPPDLSVESRVRGTQWLYNYLLGFYRDPQSVTGWNNVVFPNVAMPHALWELSGTNRLVTQEFPTREEAEGAAIAAKALAVFEPGRDHKYLVKTLEVDVPGAMSPVQYRAAVADLVNFMDYVGEPSKLKRSQLGIVVLLFLAVLFTFAYWLKREYWKDVH
jgi:ubiquinol-cytochrome c reductase cytochrome c1 subunit